MWSVCSVGIRGGANHTCVNVEREIATWSLLLTRLVRIRGNQSVCCHIPPGGSHSDPDSYRHDTSTSVRLTWCLYNSVTPSFSSPDPLRRSSTHVRIRTRYVYDTHRSASARVNAPTAYTAHPACVYALPLARKRL